MKKSWLLLLAIPVLFLASCSPTALLGGAEGTGLDAGAQSRLPIDPNPEPNPDPLPVADRPDLIITALNVDNYTSTRIYYSYTVKNVGTASIPLSGIAMQAYISVDSVLTSSDTPIGFNLLGTSGVLAPGASVSNIFSTTPAPGVIVPERYLFLKAITSAAELSKSNNTRYTQIYLRWVDFKYTSVTAAFGANNYILTTAVIKNNGLQSVLLAGVNQQMYISSNATWDSSDLPSGGFSVSAMTGKTQLAAGESVTVSFAASRPSGYNPLIHRFVVFKIDSNNSIFEVDETNNVSADSIP